MDNIENLGAAIAAAAAKDQVKSQEDRIQLLERQVHLLAQQVWDMQRNFAVLRSGL